MPILGKKDSFTALYVTSTDFKKSYENVRLSFYRPLTLTLVVEY